MGEIWKVTMPLLSTLAALVIIVHSAEEIYERDSRQIRSRALDVAPPNYEQSLKAVEIEPETTMPSQIIQEEVWGDDSSIQPNRRRRRKRKRRPNQPQDETSPQEHFLYREASETHQQDTVEMPRRRRKKVEYQDSRERNGPKHWNEEDSVRPLRRRGQRRKRPPILSEFNNFNQYDKPDSREEVMQSQDTHIDSSSDQNDAREVNEHIESEIPVDQSEPQFVEITSQAKNVNNKLPNEKILQKDDRSLSEFSSELIQSAKTTNKNVITSNLREKPNMNDNNEELPKAKGAIDPITLKNILKKSNGKSLSEMLQQNNLSLADLLHGEEKAISILQRKEIMNNDNSSENKIQNTFIKSNVKAADLTNNTHTENIKSDNKKRPQRKNYREEKQDVETTTDCSTDIEITTINDKENSKDTESISTEQSNNLLLVESTTRNYLRRRFPTGARRTLRMRPALNNTYKGQLSRDLITLTSLKYKNSKTLSKSKEWREVLPEMTRRGQNLIKQNVASSSDVAVKITSSIPAETTTEKVFETTTTDISDEFLNTETTFYMDSGKTESLSSTDVDGPNFKTESPLPTTTMTHEDLKEDKETATDKPKIVPFLKHVVNASDLRRQAYNNRLKRKRLKQKISTTEFPEERGIKDIYGTSNFVSASEFIAKTQVTKSDPVDDYSTLEDFITTEASKSTKVDKARSTRLPQRTNRFTGSLTTVSPFTTGETAKYEIDEILNDNLASARLTKILKDRNMTLSELVEHRERGSSHVHLADIFHNASKEPNPPEPFLSKSLIEPISKETYPLRALLEANSYDPKTTTIEPNLNGTNNLNIPVIMDFGNNVNENGENNGIISLFNNFSRVDVERQNVNDKDRQLVEEKSNENISKTEAEREGRLFKSEKELVSWNDLIALMQNNHQRQNIEDQNESTLDSTISNALRRNHIEKEIDHGGEMVLEDLQRLKDLDSRLTSDELLEFKLYENIEQTKIPSVLGSASNSNTKSVTVATASIIGLVLILFLLTYAILKWKQQNKMFQKKHANEDECVPTPIFENRKGLKINSSTRSKSPMIASSNIYAIDTIDTRARSESPEYMWDTLRKPFQ